MAVAKKRASKPEAPSPEGYSWPELYRLVGTTLRAGLSVLLRGHPGVGKSTLAQALASDLGLPLIDIRLAQRDPSDLAGVWFPDKEQQMLVAYPPAWAKMAAEQPCLVFLDEINAAVTKLHQAAQDRNFDWGRSSIRRDHRLREHRPMGGGVPSAALARLVGRENGGHQGGSDAGGDQSVAPVGRPPTPKVPAWWRGVGAVLR